MSYYVYFIGELNVKTKRKKHRYSAIKIGIAKSIEKRMAELQIGNPRKLELFVCLPFASRKFAERVEKQLHFTYRYNKLRGEWFHGHIDLKRIEYRQLEVIDDKEVHVDNVIKLSEQHFRSI